MASMSNKNVRIIVAVLALLLLAYALWNYVSGWYPSRGEYAVQGLVADESNGKPDWPMLGATGVDFAYITATQGATRRDTSFASNLEGVMQAGIRYGALHHFDICRLASDQATLFITTVPRSKNALPAAVQLDFKSSCSSKPNRELILSELTTFLNQLEAHTGTPAILLIAPDFEAQYRISGAIDRNIWVEGTWFLPDYSAKPWVMWTANRSRSVAGVDGRVRWAVVRN
jgi:lysozyme